MKETQETRIKRGHITLMKHRATALWGGVFLLGKTEVEDGDFTASTDGVNKRYCRQFVADIKKDSKIRGLIMHENLHVGLKQLPRGLSMFKEHHKLANMAADFVVNAIIFDIKDKLSNGELLVELPDEALHDEMFNNWSMRAVYDYLKKNEVEEEDSNTPDGVGGNSAPSDGDGDGDGQPSGKRTSVTVNGKKYDTSKHDEHDYKGLEKLSPEELKKVNDGVEKAIREGGILAGRLGSNIPRAVTEMLEPKIDWRDVLRDFVQASTKGNEELTWRKLNKRQLSNDVYLPSYETDTMGEVIIAIDTSGSIGETELNEFATELASVCAMCTPEKVRVLWWDTRVHGEQVFLPNYEGIGKLLKPLGGGGTIASCVAEYIITNKVKSEAVIMFTDGYLEQEVIWDIAMPTLWMVTSNRGFTPPVGKVVIFDKE